ncbi:MAG: hypothetical protein WD066_18425 [Planctomycetaceae bacterium]
MTRKRREPSKSNPRRASAPKSRPSEKSSSLKLGNSSRFVESRLRELPQEEFAWEAGFRAQGTRWLIMVVETECGIVLADRILDDPPDVNDLAGLLADAMQQPLSDVEPYRPATIRLRPDPVWTELLPHLEQLGIEIVESRKLPVWDATFDKLKRVTVEMQHHRSMRHPSPRGRRAASRVERQRPLPRTLDAWLDEIEEAWEEAAESIPFGSMIGTPFGDTELFHLAPHVVMKFRGLDAKDEKLQKKVVEGALMNYVANTSEGASAAGPLHSEPKLAFALCYVAAHMILEMIDENQATEILDRVAEYLEDGF